jgi:3-oxoacyl-[acyl-carrier protein] reductase
MQMIVKSMLKNRSGVILNMASVGGIETNPGYLAYGSSKAALIYATKCLSKEVGIYGIRVNAIAPGLIETQMGNYKSEDEKDKVVQRTSLRRTGEVDDIAQMVLYLSSDKAKYITGQVIRVDGGR